MAPFRGGAVAARCPPVKLFTLGERPLLDPDECYTPFDLSPDDRRFLMSRAPRAAEIRRSLLLVENWFEDIKAKVGGVTGAGANFLSRSENDPSTTIYRVAMVGSSIHKQLMIDQ